MQLDLRHVVFEGKRGPEPRRALRQHAPHDAGHRHAPLLTSHPAHDFLRWIIGRAGLDINVYRRQPLLRRVPACLRTLNVGSTEEARERLETRPDLLPAAISALLIGVTEFFREPAVFESVRTEVLPRLVGKRRPLRVWSGACSTGEELYSLAILLAEAGLLRRSFLLGTDCRTDAIARARTALYGSAAVGSLEPAIREQVFRAGRQVLASDPAVAAAGPLEGRRSGPADRGGALGPDPLEKCGDLLEPGSGRNDVDSPGGGVKTRWDVDRRQGRTAAGGLEIAPRGTLRLSQERALMAR